MADEKVIVEVGAKDTATPVLDDVAGKTESMGSRMKSSLAGAEDASKKFALALAGVGAAGAAGLLVAINAAAGAQEQMAKFNATMATMGKAGEEAKAALLSAADGAVRLGFDDEDAANSLANLYQRTNSVTEAMKLNQLAMDVSRAKGLSLEDSTKAVGMVLSGNAKLLKQYNIDLNDAASPMEALAELQTKVAGQGEAYANTLKGQMETIKIVFGNFLEEVGAPFLGYVTAIIKSMLGWVESMGGVAGIIEKITAAFAVLQPYLPIIAGMIVGALIPAFYAWGVTLMTVTIPAIIAAVTALAPFIIIGGAVAAVAVLIYEAWNTNFLGFRDVVMQVFTFLMPYFQAFMEFVKLVFQTLSDTVQFFLLVWQTNMYGVRDITATIWNGIKTFFQSWWEIVKGIFQVAMGILTGDWTLAWEGVKNIAEGIFKLTLQLGELFWKGMGMLFDVGMKLLSSAWSGFMDGIASLAGNIWEGVKNVFKDGINWIIDKMNSFIRGLSAVTGAVGKAIGQKNWSIPEIPRLAAGGIVTQPTFAMIGEAGPEAIIPLNRASGVQGMGTTIVIEGNHFYGDDEQFVAKLGDKIMDMLSPHISYTT